MISHERGMVSAKEAAKILGITEETLRIWRARSSGPPYIKLFGRYRYVLDDIAKWQDSQRVTPGK